jgi:dipeptidyl aminopeptidase/acylaminoacyl peptidase
MKPIRAGTPLALVVALTTALGACATGAGEMDAPDGPRPQAGDITYSPDSLTAADYRAAERFLRGGLDSLYTNNVGGTRWLEDGRLAYLLTTDTTRNVVVVDPETGAMERHEPGSAGAEAILEAWRGGGTPYQVVASPDGRLGAFIKDHDLWVRDLETGEEYPVTDDGEDAYGYATNSAGWIRSPRPVVMWSPDSRRIATFRQDERGVGMMYTVTTNVGHPELDAWRYPLPEDSVIFRIERLVADVSDVDDPSVTFFDMLPDPHRSATCDHIYCAGRFLETEWYPDADSVAFLSVSRDHKRVALRIASADDGGVREVLRDSADTFFLSAEWGERQNWRVLPESDELIWWDRDTNWGHLYLHDLDSGERRHAITAGNWNVLTVERVDPESRTIWFIGNGREDGDPYFRYLYSVNMDEGPSSVRLLSPDSANHRIDLSPDGRFFVDNASTPTSPGVVTLRDAGSGDAIAELARPDISRMLAAGWKAPIPFTVKARDNSTDLYGIMYVPTSLDTTKQYPVVNYIYPGPQGGSVGSRSFSPRRSDHQALAELGFVVVTLDGLGSSSERSKSFHDFYYGNMGDNTIPDQIAAIRQLAARHPWIDLDRVGTWGHSGGGFASTRAILAYPDFYTVAVSQAGNHENRNYEDDWGEWWQGLLVEYDDGSTNYDNQANWSIADQLEGKLLIAHGMMDDNVPMSNTMLVVKALIEADKDFDLILFPDSRHGFAGHPFMQRNRWDYFVEHLLESKPPAGYTIGSEEGG